MSRKFRSLRSRKLDVWLVPKEYKDWLKPNLELKIVTCPCFFWVFFFFGRGGGVGKRRKGNKQVVFLTEV
jgi:hypothetical protein